MISKETFVMAMNELRRAHDYQEGLNNFFKSNDVDGFIYQPDCSLILMKVLEEAMNLPIDGKVGSDVSYFCYELDYGRNYKPGDVNDCGVDVDFSTPEKLYDYVTADKKDN